MPGEEWALLPSGGEARIAVSGDSAVIENGSIRAELSPSGKLSFFGARGRKILGESRRIRKDILSEDCSALEIEAREFRPIIGGDYALTARFESLDPRERIYGMGRYQQSFIDLKGSELELAHRNSRASVPFYLSSLGYGFLWNNPSVDGRPSGRTAPRGGPPRRRRSTIGSSPPRSPQPYSSATPAPPGWCP
jgi:alpha-D-xyloside xylohydrolase